MLTYRHTSRPCWKSSVLASSMDLARLGVATAASRKLCRGYALLVMMHSLILRTSVAGMSTKPWANGERGSFSLVCKTKTSSFIFPTGWSGWHLSSHRAFSQSKICPWYFVRWSLKPLKRTSSVSRFRMICFTRKKSPLCSWSIGRVTRSFSSTVVPGVTSVPFGIAYLCSSTSGALISGLMRSA